MLRKFVLTAAAAGAIGFAAAVRSGLRISIILLLDVVGSGRDS